MATENSAIGERETRLYEIIGAYYAAVARGEEPDRRRLRDLDPDLADDLDAFFDDQDRFHRATEPLRDASTSSPTEDDREVPAIGDFGDFDLIAEIARGGMGVVYRAWQRGLNRPVALKMMLPGRLASAEDLARFRNEAEAVAHLDHPHIVPVHEVGEHEGRSYFAMKLVEGGSLDHRLADYLDRPEAAASLVARVARAIHHAHQRGILHRDLKPSNVLIDDDGQPLVTDFGLARRVEGDGELTDSGAILGSPPYMAAEQTSGRKGVVTTATDVYGLGAILYATLTGRPPFRGDTPLETLDHVREREPEPPSTLNHRVDRDLQTICLKCLAKDPSRRYASAEALADDLERWLRGEPIEARRVGRAERAWSWCRRNPAVASLAAIVAILGLSGVVGLAVSNAMISRRNARIVLERDNAKRSQGEAEAARDQAEAVGRYLVDVFRRPDPDQDGREVKAVDLLDQATTGLESEFEGSPRIKGELLDALGRTYRGLGQYARSVEILEKASATLRSALGPDAPETLRSRNNLAWAYSSLGWTQELTTLAEETLRLARARFGPDHSLTLSSMHIIAVAYHDAGRMAESASLHEETLRRRRAILGADHPQTIDSLSDLAITYHDSGRLIEALPLYEEVLKLRRATLGPDHIQTIDSLTNLAVAYHDAGRLAESVALHEEILKHNRARHGPNHLSTIRNMENLAGTYRTAGRLAESVGLHEKVLPLLRAKLGPEHIVTIRAANNLAATYLDDNRPTEALPLYEESLRLCRSGLGPDHPDTIRTMAALAATYRAADQYDRAILLGAEALGLQRSRLGPDHSDTIRTLVDLAEAYRADGQLDEAEPLFRQGREAAGRILGPRHEVTLSATHFLAHTLVSLGRPGEAGPFFREALAACRQIRGPEDDLTLDLCNDLAGVLNWTDQPDQAEPLLRELVAARKKIFGPDHPLVSETLALLGINRLTAEKGVEAEPPLREALAIRQRQSPEGWTRFELEILLGASLLGQGKHAEAEPLILSGYRGMERLAEEIPPQIRAGRLAQAGQHVVWLYEAWGKPDQAEKWRAKLGQRAGAPGP
jgi:eukaryotic-like serine/threonine-protein kinase